MNSLPSVYQSEYQIESQNNDLHCISMLCAVFPKIVDSEDVKILLGTENAIRILKQANSPGIIIINYFPPNSSVQLKMKTYQEEKQKDKS